MSYSSTDVLSTRTDSHSSRMASGGTMTGRAYTVEKGIWGRVSAHSLFVKKEDTTWTVFILDDRRSTLGTFSFPEKKGMKATIETQALRTDDDKNPTKYNKLEVSCHHTLL